MACTFVSFARQDFGCSSHLAFCGASQQSVPLSPKLDLCQQSSEQCGGDRQVLGLYSPPPPPEQNRALSCRALLKDPKDWVRLWKLSNQELRSLIKALSRCWASSLGWGL